MARRTDPHGPTVNLPLAVIGHLVLTTLAARCRLELEPNQIVAPAQMLTSVPRIGFGCGLWKC